MCDSSVWVLKVDTNYCRWQKMTSLMQYVVAFLWIHTILLVIQRSVYYGLVYPCINFKMGVCPVSSLQMIKAQICATFINCRITWEGFVLSPQWCHHMVWLVTLWGSHVQQHSEPTRAMSFSLLTPHVFSSICRRLSFESCIFFRV